MQKDKRNIMIWVVVIFVIAVVASFFVPSSENKEPGKYDEFAKCLKEKNAIFYGASWCSHCNAQKEDFGSSQKYLPYVECSTPDGRSQTKQCEEAKIDGYPTWQFPDGSRQSGRLPMEVLAEKTGCQLPQ